jgi:hypothetical protein
MAREEQDREDLLAEATALFERIELEVEGFADPVLIGFRRDGCASVYIGADPAFHFNTRLELRRAFVAGLLYKAQRARLVALERKRVGGEVQLLRTDLDRAAEDAFLANCQQVLARLQAGLQSGKHRTIGQVPPAADILARVRIFLESVPVPLRIATSPHAR